MSVCPAGDTVYLQTAEHTSYWKYNADANTSGRVSFLPILLPLLLLLVHTQGTFSQVRDPPCILVYIHIPLASSSLRPNGLQAELCLHFRPPALHQPGNHPASSLPFTHITPDFLARVQALVTGIQKREVNATQFCKSQSLCGILNHIIATF